MQDEEQTLPEEQPEDNDTQTRLNGVQQEKLGSG